MNLIYLNKKFIHVNGLLIFSTKKKSSKVIYQKISKLNLFSKSTLYFKNFELILNFISIFYFFEQEKK